MNSESFQQLVDAGEPPQPGQPPAPATTTVEKPTLVLTSASELMVKDIPPIDFLVVGLLPQGLSMLAAPPKYGKSWIALYLCLAVASGENFLGHKTHQANTYYMALEDSERRMKTRLETLLAGAEAPAGCHISYVAPTMDSDLFAQLDLVLKSYPEIKLIIIDTLQKVRGMANWREGAYASDYRELGTLKKFADQHNISILLIHHLRKMIDTSDPFTMISGTNGVLGSVDTAMVLSKAARSDDNTTLSIVGRDVDSADIVLRFDPDSCRWGVVGSAADIAAEKDRQSYEANPIVRTVKALLEQNPDGWTGTATQLLEAGLQITQQSIAASPRGLTAELLKLDDQLLVDSISHDRFSHGTGGGKHRFRRIPSAEEVLNAPLPDIPF